MTAEPGSDAPRVVLVETSEALPGLLPFQAWEALAEAEVVHLRDPDAHPSAEHLRFAGLELARLEPATLDHRGLDLGRPGSPEDRRIAKALLEAAGRDGRVVYLLGPADEGLTRVVGRESVDHPAEVEMVFLAQAPRGTELIRLVGVMERLRDPEEGCPWDLEQDHASLVDSLVEETYELVEAIDRGRDAEIREELGDVLLQVVFHAQVALDRRAFSIDDVARTITDKLVRRHPHVFGDLEVTSADEVKANWETIKRSEGRESPLDAVPMALPALQLTQKLQRRMARVGFDPWAGTDAEVREALGGAGRPAADLDEADLGRLLEAVVALARRRGLDAEQALRGAARSLRDRYRTMAARAASEGLDLAEADEATLAELWREATADTGTRGTDPEGSS